MTFLLLEPFSYAYMSNAIWLSTLVGAVCGCLSAFLMLKGWSLIGDALAHSVVPGVAVAYLFALPFSFGAFIAAGLAALSMLFFSNYTGLKTDVVIGVIFTSFFGLGLFIASLYPASIQIETIVMGNILAITPEDRLQLILMSIIIFAILVFKWKDLMVIFFDENHARSIGLSVKRLKLLFFAMLAICIVAALQAVGAILVVAMVITPGATAYLLCDRFGRLILLSMAIGALTSFIGAYSSYHLNGATGAVIVSLQTILFLFVFIFAPKHGLFAYQRKARLTLEEKREKTALIIQQKGQKNG